MVRVTTKDAQGNPVGNTAFTLKRNTSVNRANVSTTTSRRAHNGCPGKTQDDFSFNNSTDLWRDGADGIDNFHIETGQDHGFKTRTDRHALDPDNNVKSTLPVVFTVITSPIRQKQNSGAYG